MSGRRALLWKTGLFGVLALVFSSCSSSSPESVSPTTPPSTSPQVERSADGVLRLGFLVPLADEQAPFGPQLELLVQTLVRLMNGLGGFGGQDIELVVRDEGSSPESARVAATALITTDRVDAVIGPFSSVNAPSVVPELTSAEIAVCSPSVSSQLMDVLDDDGLFLRTSATDSAIVSNMVKLAVESGNEQVSIAYPDDPYGRTLAREMRELLNARNLEVVSAIPYQISAVDYREDAVRLTSDGISIKLIIGDPIDGPRFLNAVVAESPKSVIIANDGLVDATVVFNPNVSTDQRPRIVGYTPDVEKGGAEVLNILRFTDPNYDDDLTSLPAFSVNTIDCFSLIWLAALAAESDDAMVFKAEIPQVANNGSTCLWIAECKISVDENLNINYEGINALTLDSSGNALDRPLIVFEFDDEGRAQTVQGTLNITVTG